jgi:hypothetical protein
MTSERKHMNRLTDSLRYLLLIALAAFLLDYHIDPSSVLCDAGDERGDAWIDRAFDKALQK